MARTVKTTKRATPARAERKAVPARAEPADPFHHLRNEIDRVFEDFATGFGLPALGRSIFDLEGWPWPRRALADAVARVDVSESDKALEITAELPGMDEKDVEVTISEDMLTISGEKHAETEEKGKDCHMRERSFGSFRRSFRLPREVDLDKIKASFEKGVLHVTVPKPAQRKAAAKKIAVQRKG
jgi:HSP20 family protein